MVDGENEIPKLTYEELEKENTTLKGQLKYSQGVSRAKEEAWGRSEKNYKIRISELQKEINKLKEKPSKPVQEERPPIFTYTDTPFNKLASLLERALPPERIKEELGELQKYFSRPTQYLTSIDEMTSRDKTKINRYNQLMNTLVEVSKTVHKHCKKNNG